MGRPGPAITLMQLGDCAYNQQEQRPYSVETLAAQRRRSWLRLGSVSVVVLSEACPYLRRTLT